MLKLINSPPTPRRSLAGAGAEAKPRPRAAPHPPLPCPSWTRLDAAVHPCGPAAERPTDRPTDRVADSTSGQRGINRLRRSISSTVRPALGRAYCMRGRTLTLTHTHNTCTEASDPLGLPPNHHPPRPPRLHPTGNAGRQSPSTHLSAWRRAAPRHGWAVTRATLTAATQGNTGYGNQPTSPRRRVGSHAGGGYCASGEGGEVGRQVLGAEKGDRWIPVLADRAGGWTVR